VINVVQNNLWEFRSRVTLVQGKAPEDFAVLSQLEPDVVFIDAMKKQSEFVGADTAFPRAVIAGDDWSWRDNKGRLIVQDYVKELARKRNGKIYAHRQTFIVAEPDRGLAFDEQYLVP
jgi:hypothetical protein